MSRSDCAPSGEIPLPFVVVVPRSTYHETPLTRVSVDEVKIRESTKDGGWPTVILGKRDGKKVGMAFDYNAQWHDGPTEEIAVYHSGESWWIVVEFEPLESAKSAAQYQRGSFGGYTTLSSKYADSPIDRFREYTDDDVTLLIPTPEADSDAVYAIQSSKTYSALTELFSLDDFEALSKRRNRLHRIVTPNEEWTGKNELESIARDTTGGENYLVMYYQ